jgi:hypothetical protein
MSASIVSLQAAEKPWCNRTAPLVVGKDILELLSTSMYVDAMTLYREYVQNAADAIDQARESRILNSAAPGKVDIFIDPGKRSVVIRDNGCGIPSADFEQRLSSFGASTKRGTAARGFRGVGRLAAIGCCQELVFRSRFAGEHSGNEMRWDCRQVKTVLKAAANTGLEEVVNSCVQTRPVPAAHLGEHGFEVEMRGIVRHRNDVLLNPLAVYEYLAQVAPVPFSPDFKLGYSIREVLGTILGAGELQIMIVGCPDPVFKPHRDSIVLSSGDRITFREVEPVRIPANDGGDAGLGWILHHEYKGAIPLPQLRGLRLRAGNIQVGGSDLLQDHFQEPRFNSWSVGEIHTLDQRIVPNGRRDHFEQNVHFDNLVNHLSVVARNIGSRCRSSSAQRNWIRKFDQHHSRVNEHLKVLQQGAVGESGSRLIQAEIALEFEQMKRIARKENLSDVMRAQLESDIAALAKLIAKFPHTARTHKRLKKLSPVKRHVYEHAFSLIYKHCQERSFAQRLVEAMLSEI